MKGSKGKATATGSTSSKTGTGASASSKTGGSGAGGTSSSGARNPATASKDMITVKIDLDKNSKDAFLKKLQLCMKNYDYKDETKDVRGKVRI